MSGQDLRSDECHSGSFATKDADVIDASFEITPASYCPDCGVMYALRLSPRPCPFLHRSEGDHDAESVGENMIDSASRISTELPRGVEENLPSYYEHLSLSLLAPETPEEEPSPRRRRRLQTTALPLPDHMDTIGDFLEGVVAYVEVRSDLGDHSGAIGTLLYRMGASIVLTLSSSVTHAVLCSARSAIVRRAKSMAIQVVAARWVMACKDQLRRVEEEDWPMLTDAEDYKGLRQYRYKVSGVNDTPSPMSVRNLALLSRTRRLQSRRQGDSPLSSPGSPRRVWQSPRKSLRRVLFTRPDPSRPPALSEFESEGGESEDDISMLSIPETQEITEVAETQDQCLPFPLPVPETDPAMFDRKADFCGGEESIEIPETQPSDTNYPVVADPDFANLDLSAWGASGQHSPNSQCHQTKQEGPSLHDSIGNLDVEADLNLEESFNSLSVNDRSEQLNANGQLETSSENMDIVIGEERMNETDNDPDNQWFPVSQGTQMELTRVLQVLPRKSTSRMVPPNASMVLTQPASAHIQHSDRLETFSHEVGDSSELCVDIKGVSPSLELVLPQGTSQSLLSTTSPTKENTALFLEAARRSTEASENLGNSCQKAQNLCSEEIAMSWSGLEKKMSTSEQRASEGRQNPDSASISFSLSGCTEKRGSCASVSEPRKIVELAPVKASTRGSLSKRTSDVVTPIPDRLQARVSGVFSDDNSPCIDTRRTIVLTGFKNKRSIVKSLKQLSRTNGQYDLANEVTTRTEVVVIEEHKRTLAVLLGISWGCWFVSAEWATKSVKAGRWLEFEKFEVRDYLTPMVTNRMARTGHIEGSETKIFRDLKVFVTRRGSLKPSADALQRMVLQAGGKVVFDSRQAHVYVGQSKSAKKTKCQFVTASWIVESVAAGQAQPFDDYSL